ncbi:MAG: acyl carrier protein [Pseudomonadales bacterium]|nr:acyl carrier protein [Halioglobus sp.]MCP5130071.1 acyl carrier protein [Pseudomonadales bacterium]
MRTLILRLMAEIAENTDCSLVEDLQDNTVLLESGLDSLGFAILVARLEEELGRDPFTETDDIVYPRTLGEFIAIYEQ